MKNLGKHLYSYALKLTISLLSLVFIIYPFRDKITFFNLTTDSLFFLIGLLIFILAFGISISLINVKSKKILILTGISYYCFYHLFYPIIHKLFDSESIYYQKFSRLLIAYNNNIRKKQIAKYDRKDILILLPHCLQNADCPYKVTSDIDNCHDCGKCLIQDFKAIQAEYGIKVRIATGGTLARKIIKDIRPKIILAVACHRDLTEGIKDIDKIPVIGILNSRPNGPCYNTSCDIKEIKTIINKIL